MWFKNRFPRSLPAGHALAVAAEVVRFDLGFLKMNGYGVSDNIRREPLAASAVRVAWIGWGQEEEHKRSFEAGFDHHLTMPVRTAAIEELLASLA
jgi:CheY-like chemotaxis protein